MEEKKICKVEQLDNNDILPNRFQPRKYFDEEEILQLAESIKEHGVINPIIVRKLGDKYELVAGERRYKANILAGNDSIPAIVMDVNDKESSEIAVVENIQRKDLNPVEEAISYKRSLDIGYMTQEQLAQKMGKSQSYIANKIRLLKLSDEVQDALMKKEISERHARSLLKLDSLKKQNELLKRIIAERLTVRKTDEEIEKMNNNINNSIGGTYNMNNAVLGNNIVSPTLDINSSISNNNQNYVNPSTPAVSGQPTKETDLKNLNILNPLSSPSNLNQNQSLENNNFMESRLMPEENITPIIPDKTVSDIKLESFNIQAPPVSLMKNQNLENNIFSVPQTSPIEEKITPIEPVVDTLKTSDVNLDLFNSIPTETNTILDVAPSFNNNDFEPPQTTSIEEEITPIIPERNMPEANLNSFDFSTTDIQSELNQSQQIGNNEFTTSALRQEEISNQSVPTIGLNSNDINIPTVESISSGSSLNDYDMKFSSNTTMDNPDLFISSNLYPKSDTSNEKNSLNSNILNNNLNIKNQKEDQIFKSDPIIDTTLSQNIKNDESQLSDLDISIGNNESSINDVSNFYKPETKPEPIIVNEYNQQYDPIMPDNSNNQPTIDFKSILNLIRKCSAAIENSGYKIETEEYNLDNLYQVVFKIEKK